jgi:plastocyanin
MTIRLRLLPLLAGLTVMTVLAIAAGCGSSNSNSNGDGGGGVEICGCSEATAQDLTAQTSVTVSFGGAVGLAYSPKCILVAPGTSVSFEGEFSTHPLSATVGSGNPITHTTSGTTASFTFNDPGSFGYQCDVHFASGMCGAVYVQ